jgi:hypothetical protein
LLDRDVPPVSRPEIERAHVMRAIEDRRLTQKQAVVQLALSVRSDHHWFVVPLRGPRACRVQHCTTALKDSFNPARTYPIPDISIVKSRPTLELAVDTNRLLATNAGLTKRRRGR